MARTKVVRGTCSVSECGLPHKAAGFCASHYQRFKRGADTNIVLRRRDRNPPAHCTEPDCAEPVKSKGLCKKHYARLLKHGFTRFRNRTKPAKPCTHPGCENHLYANGLCNQHYLRKRRLLEKYGLTFEAYAAMLEAQAGVCAICLRDPGKQNAISLKVNDFCVDHSHVTNKVRGLLCDHCNRAIGLLGDDPAVLRSAASYLESHSRQ